MLQQLLKNIWRYLSAQCTLQDLEAWVLSNLQRILDTGDKAAIRMANQIDADLVELGEGLIDESTFLERLQSLVRLSETIPFTFGEKESRALIHATTHVETIKCRAEVRPVVDLRLDHVFA